MSEHTHTPEVLEAVEPTCTESGLTAGKKCSSCGEILESQTTIEAKGHTEEALEAVEPTCTESGLTGGKKCSSCGEILESQTTIEAKGHTEEALAAVEPTCTETGLTDGKKCTVCKAVTVKQTKLAANGHTKVNEANGEAYCSVCKAVLVKIYNATYEIGTLVGATGSNGTNKTRFRTVEFIPIEDFQIVTLESGYKVTWLAYDAEKNYMGNGSNTYPTLPTGGIWLADGKGISAEEILEWNRDVKYVRFAFCKTSAGDISLDTDVVASKVRIYSSGYEPPAPTVYTYEYAGESLGTTNTVTAVNVAGISGLQDGAVYGDYFFAFSGTGVCKVYSTDKFKLVSQFTLDKVDIFKPHSNSVCFGTLKYDENDEFPLIYNNIYNNYGKDNADMIGACGVYRIVREGDSFKSTLVQVIKVGFTSDTELWASPNGDTRPYGNFVVDTDRNKLIAFTMRDEDSSTRFFEFDIPNLDAGVLDETLGVKKVTLTKNDIKESFSVPYFRYVQGCTYYNGRVYSLEGFTDNEKNPASLKIVDLSKKELLTEINLQKMGLTVEPEAAFVIDGELYYAEVSGNIYKLTFH